MNLIMAYLVLRFCSTKGFPRHLFSSMAIMTALVVMSNTTATTPPTIAIVSLTVMNGAETKTENIHCFKHNQSALKWLPLTVRMVFADMDPPSEAVHEYNPD